MGKFLPMERASAKANGEKLYFTGRPCKYGHIDKRHTSNGSCCVCFKLKHEKWKENNKELLKEVQKKSYLKYAEKKRRIAKEYREKYPEKVKEVQRKYYENNLHKIIFHGKKRAMLKRKAMPLWLNKEQIKQIKNYYKVASDIMKETGIKINVDHIVPLKGKTVCGLHVPWNLRIITAKDNASKFNHLIDFPWKHSNNGIMIGSSALPWNLKKEQQNGN